MMNRRYPLFCSSHLLWRLLGVYIAIIALFTLWTVLFVFYHHSLYAAYPLSTLCQMVWNGLPHSISVAGYFMALPLLISLLFVWIKPFSNVKKYRFYRGFCSSQRCYDTLCTFILPFYFGIMTGVALVILFADIMLFGYWRFRIDNTALQYFLDAPAECLSQASFFELISAIVMVMVLSVGVFLLLRKVFTLQLSVRSENSIRKSIKFTLIHVLFAGVMFIGIRGGVTTSTMTVGRVYFSTDVMLNQGATNPVFSFFHSLVKSNNLNGKYIFFSDSELADIQDVMEEDLKKPVLDDKIGNFVPKDSLFYDVKHPDILIIIGESFSGTACHALTPDADSRIMPTVNSMAEDAIFFDNFYANSWRTDRALASILASFPSQPTHSIMRDQRRLNSLPYFTSMLKEQGYDLEFLHGGDVDFTNMRGFLRAAGFQKIVSDHDFPLKDRLSKWGVADDVTFSYLLDDIKKARKNRDKTADNNASSRKPFLKVMLTLSSHEPFDVPFHRFADDISKASYEQKYINSVAFTDSIMGDFLGQLSMTPAWDNLLVVFVADHAAPYPSNIQIHETRRYRVPMFWTGGVVRRAQRISVLCSQTDIGASLLRLLDIPSEELSFSHDVFSDKTAHFAYYSWPDGFGFLTPSEMYMQDNNHDGVALSGSYDAKHKAERYGKAYLQTIYNELRKK